MMEPRQWRALLHRVFDRAVLAQYIKDSCDGVVVGHKCSLDEPVAKMQERGWRVRETAYIAGKRIRIMDSPME